MIGPDCNWLSKRSQQNKSGLIAVASPVEQQNNRRANGHTVAGDSSEDEESWKVVERCYIDHKAALNIHEIVDDLYQRATHFMHDSDSGVRMDEDFVGKQQDLYLWCSVGGSEN